MKQTLIILVVFITAVHLQGSAQDATVAIKPSAYSDTAKKNYVRTWEVLKPVTNPNDIDTLASLQLARMSTQYLDGLGRPLQTVIKQGSLITGGTAVDLVTANVYDSLGREIRKYLPFAANNTGGNTAISTGMFKKNPFHQQEYFYSNSNTNSPIKDQGETYYYGKTEYEASPLDRVERTYAPGNAWASGSGKGVKVKYRVNTALDSVRIWTVSISSTVGSFSTYATAAMYGAGKLNKTITIDENDKQVIEFKDNNGLVILKKVQLTAAADDVAGKGHTGWLCTYYIYDDFNQLRAVVQPRGVELLMANSWNIAALSGVILKEQCFRYEYDGMKHMTMKQVPGAGAVQMVYDARDRLVLTQDSLLRLAGKWLYTQYDALNRPVATGLWTTANNLAYHAVRADTSIAYPNLAGQTIEVLTNTFYDDYSWRASYSNPLSATRSTTYDSHLLAASNTTYPYPQSATVQSTMLKGLVTGGRVKVLGTASTYLYTVNFYDDKGRLIQVQSTNLSGGTDIVLTQYSFSGQPLLTIAKTEKAGTGAQTSVTVTKPTLDDLGRVVKVEKKLSNTNVNSGSMSSYVTLSEQEYDALGQLKKKKLGSTPIETLNYAYNIRGWLLGMNRDYAKSTSSTINYFGFDLGYDKTAITPTGGASIGNYTAQQFNGNITGTVWKSYGDKEIRKYDFTYDAVNRLTGADFNQYSSGFNKNAGMDFSVSGLTYDANGNILSMKHRGWKATSSVTIDSLKYNYIANSNRLLNVIDGVNDAQTKLGDFRTSSLHPNSGSKNNSTIDYSYDGNGNMVKDLNKDIITYAGTNGIAYNYLNLPQTITVRGASGNKGTIEYTYDATGNKLKKTVTEGAFVTTTLYQGGAVYRNDTLEFMVTEEGRLRYNPIKKVLDSDYFIKDHLGNVRAVLTAQMDTSFYPAVTFEDASTTNEQIYYEKAADQRVARPGSFYTSGTNGAKVQLLRKSTQSIGAGKLLKVMAKDRIHVKVDYYMPNDATDNSTADGLNSLLTALTGLLNNSPVTGGLHGSGSTIATNLNASVPFTNFLAPQGSGQASAMPKAYLNIIFFDEQFKFVGTNSEIIQVSVKGSGQTIMKMNGSAKEAVKNGYAYVYVSNESNNMVYFDNLQVTHERGPIIDETHYYGFGLTMKGISSSALNFGKENKIKFQEQEFTSKEFSDGSGLNMYEFKYRMHDPQIGRFWQIDPLAHDYRYNSTYAFSENKVINGRELEGLEYVSIHHYADGTNGVKMHYKSTDAEINERHGTTAGLYNSASYGPLGRGVVHYYYNKENEIYDTRWDQQQSGGASDFTYHGLYSGPGSVTKDGGPNSKNYDFSFQPIDWSDAIAKRHDMDYAAATATGEKYAGFLEDTRTLQADKDMLVRLVELSNNMVNPFKKAGVSGVETPYRTSWSGEMQASFDGQAVVIGALAIYKQWKIDNNYTNKDTYDKLQKEFEKYDPITAGIISIIR